MMSAYLFSGIIGFLIAIVSISVVEIVNIFREAIHKKAQERQKKLEEDLTRLELMSRDLFYYYENLSAVIPKKENKK